MTMLHSLRRFQIPSTRLRVCLALCLGVVCPWTYAGKKMIKLPLLNEASITALKEHVTYLTQGRPRSVGNKDRLERAGNYIEDQFHKTGMQVGRQDYDAEGVTYTNITAVLNAQFDKVIVIGAHYDVCGDTPGADDNASGVAGMLELAKIIKPHADNIPYQVQFVAYSTEEPPYFRTGHMGSYHHAKSLSTANIKVRLMISLEMIGFFNDGQNTQRYPLKAMKLFYPNRGNFIAVVSKFGHRRFLKPLQRAFIDAGMPSRTLSAPGWVTGVDFSDHRNYWEFGYKAVMVTDSSFYRNPNYHETMDTVDTLDFERMRKVVNGVGTYVLRADF